MLNPAQPSGSDDPWDSAWAELQVAVNDYRLLSGEERDEAARRELVGKINDVIKADTGRWASRRRSLAESRRAS